jgi:hypothetical protein
MSQELLTLPSPKLGCPIKCCYIGFRLLRYKFYPWITLTIAPLKILATSDVNRTHEKIRCMSAISKINFVGVYALLNELLW